MPYARFLNSTIAGLLPSDPVFPWSSAQWSNDGVFPDMSNPLYQVLYVSLPTSVIAPAKIDNLAVIEDGMTNILLWDAPSNGGSPIKGYMIERRKVGGKFVVITSAHVGGTAYVDTDRKFGETYEYRVRAKNVVGFGVPSDIVQESEVPEIPGVSIDMSSGRITAVTFNEDQTQAQITILGSDIPTHNGTHTLDLLALEAAKYVYLVLPSFGGTVAVGNQITLRNGVLVTRSQDGIPASSPLEVTTATGAIIRATGTAYTVQSVDQFVGLAIRQRATNTAGQLVSPLSQVIARPTYAAPKVRYKSGANTGVLDMPTYPAAPGGGTVTYMDMTVNATVASAGSGVLMVPGVEFFTGETSVNGLYQFRITGQSGGDFAQVTPTLVAGDRVQVISLVQRNLKQILMVKNGVFEAVAQRIATESGVVARSERTRVNRNYYNANNPHDASFARLAHWYVNIDAGLTLNVGSILRELFVLPGMVDVIPDAAVALLGTPFFDIRGPLADQRIGKNYGSIGDFTPNSNAYFEAA